MRSIALRNNCLKLLLVGLLATTAIAQSSNPNPSASVSGRGETNFIARWTASTVLGKSNIFQNPANGFIGMFTTSPSAPLDVRGQVSSIVGESRAFVGVSTGTVQTLEIQNNTDAGTGFLIAGFHNGVAKFFVDTEGNLTAIGSKSAIVGLHDGRQVALYAVESPENWFEDFGEGKLQRGAAQVRLDAKFAEIANTDKYHIFLTPKGKCKGLYVSNQAKQFFEVREIGAGTATVSFDYRIVAHRKGFETLRLQDKTSTIPKLKKE